MLKFVLKSGLKHGYAVKCLPIYLFVYCLLYDAVDEPSLVVFKGAESVVRGQRKGSDLPIVVVHDELINLVHYALLIVNYALCIMN